jgi:hypothetical protein
VLQPLDHDREKEGRRDRLEPAHPADPEAHAERYEQDDVQNGIDPAELSANDAKPAR